MSTPAADIQLVRFDWAIKTILRDKANFDILEGFLTALLGEDVVIEQVLESESNAVDGSEFNHLDMLVHDRQGYKFIVKIQNDREGNYLERIPLGPAKVIVDNVSLIGPYCDVVKVVSVYIVYFNLSPGDDYVYKGTTKFKGMRDSEELELHKRAVISTEDKFNYRGNSIFPDYYLIYVDSFEDVINNPLDEWIYFLKHSAVRGNFQARHIDKAMDKLNLLKMSPAERRSYEDYVKSLVIARDVIAAAKQEGIEQERWRIAQSLLDVIADDQMLAEKTGLSTAEVQELRRSGLVTRATRIPTSVV